MGSILTGYFDESGTHAGSRALAIAGYISTVERWESFERDWSNSLRNYGTTAFHMADFVTGASPFSDWPRAKREPRFHKLVGIVNRHAMASVGVVIPLGLYDSLLTNEEKARCGGPYCLAAIGCFIQVARILRANKSDAEVAYVFERGAQGVGEVLTVFNVAYEDADTRRKFHLLSLRFEDKRRFVPLQASDVLAWELYKELPRQLGLEAQQSRVGDLRLLNRLPGQWVYTKGDELKRYAGTLAALNVFDALGPKRKR